jgi:tripeptidyl-peptidase I
MAGLCTLTTLVALISLVLAEPQLSRSVVHEKRSAIPNGWTRLERHASDAIMPMRFGLRQRNLDRIEEFLLDVSHPDSSNYGNYWTAEQIAATFAPSQETVNTVQEWLGSAGIHPDRVMVTSGKVWLELKWVLDTLMLCCSHVDDDYQCYHRRG